MNAHSVGIRPFVTTLLLGVVAALSILLSAIGCAAFHEPAMEQVHHIIPLIFLPVAVAALGMALLVRGRVLGRIVVAALLGLGALWLSTVCCYAVFFLAVPASAIPGPIAWNGLLVAVFLVAAFSRRLSAELRCIRSQGWGRVIGLRGFSR